MSQYIPKAVRQNLAKASRGRCCYCRELLTPCSVFRLKSIAKTLHKHHIQFVSEGGPNTEENLIVVCPKCHGLIHEDRSAHTPAQLRKAKAHWLGMENVVPSYLKMNDSDDSERVILPLIVLSLNLIYQVDAPDFLTVSDLERFVSQSIIAPLVHYERRAIFGSTLAHANVDSVRLTRLSQINQYLDSSLRLSDLIIQASDYLVVRLDIQGVAAMRVRITSQEEFLRLLEVELKIRFRDPDLQALSITIRESYEGSQSDVQRLQERVDGFLHNHTLDVIAKLSQISTQLEHFVTSATHSAQMIGHGAHANLAAEIWSGDDLSAKWARAICRYIAYSADRNRRW